MKKLLLVFGIVLGWASWSYAQVTAPVSEDFSSGSTPTGWSTSATSGGPWLFSGSTNSVNCSAAPDHTGNSSNYAWMDQSGSDAGVILEMPDVNVGSLTTPYLEFYYWMCGVGYTPPNLTFIETYDGTSWSVLDSITTATAGWQYFGYDLTGLTHGTNLVRVRFRAESGGASADFYGDNALDDISIIEAPTCQIPTGLTANNLTSGGATLNWSTVSNAVNGYEIIYGAAGFDPATGGTSTTTSADSLVITGLSGATTYDAYIIADCGAADGISDTSAPVSFTTNCVALTATYTRDFDSDTDGDVALCWEQYSSYGAGAYARVENFGTPRSGTQQIAMYSSGASSTNDTLAAITPQFSDLTTGNKQINFWVKTSSTTNSLIVGTLSSNSPGAAFTAVDTITFSATNSFQEVIIPFTTANGYNGTDEYIALVHSLGQTFSYIYFDDFTYEVIPPCPKLTGVSIVNVGTNTAEIQFSGSATSVDYEFGPVGFTQGTGTINTTSSSPYTITGLSPSNCYDVYVRNNCTAGGNGTSTWLGPFSICTACLTQSLPYTEDFDNNLGCMTVIDGGTSPDTWEWVPAGGNGNYFGDLDGTGHVSADSDAPGSGPTMTETLLSPYIDASNLVGTLFLEFDQFYQHLGSSAEVDVWDGTTWVNVVTQNSQNVGSFTSPDHQKIDITAYASDSLQVRFIYDDQGSWAWWWLIDNLSINEVLCLPSTNVSAFYVTQDTVGLTWNPGSGVSFSVEYGATGFTPGAGTVVGTTNDSLFVGGLTANTTYDFYLVDTCADGTSSPPVGPITILTSCLNPSAASLPWTEGFENWTGGPTYQGGTNLCNTTYNWVFEGSSANSRLRLQAGSAYYNNGAQAATMDHSPSASLPETNYLTLTINLSSYTTSGGINLGFYVMGHGQEASPNNRVWARGSKTDPWIEIYNLDANNPGNGVYDSVGGVDIVLPLTNAGQSVGAQTQIRFGQTGRFSSFSTNFSDGYTFDDISLEAVSCPNPSGLNLSALADTSATLTWAPNTNAAGYEVWFGNAGFYQGTTTVGGVKVYPTTNSFTVDTLTAQSCYEFLVRYICAPGDTSAYAGPFSFCTPCSPFFAPYVENFDASTQVVGQEPTCWSSVLEGGTGPFSAAFIYQFGTPRSSPNHIRFYNYNNSTTMLVSPLLGDLDDGDKRVSFYVRESFGGGEDVLIGTVPSPGAYTQFDTIATYTTTTTDFKFTAQLTTANGYNGTDKYVAILHGNTSSFNTLYIDDFVYEVIPTCPEPIGGNAAGTFAVDSNSAMIYWTAGGTSTGDYQVEYGTGPLGSSANTQMLFQNDTAALSNLLDGTDYCFWVRQICTPGDTSFWTGPICFQTQCASKSAPYTMDFDSQVSGEIPICWTPLFRGGSGPFAAVQVYQFGTPNSAPNHMRFYNYNTDTTMAISPLFNDINAGDKRVRFEALSTSTFGTNEIIVGTMSDITDGSTFHPLDTITLTNIYTEYMSNITTANGYNGTDDYVALLHNSTSNFRTYYVDDFKYETIPTCAPRPSGFSAYAVGSADISYKWTGGSTSSTNYVVQYGTSGILNDPTNTIMAIANDSLTITGLTSNTNYCAWVAEVCTPGDTSIWEGPVCVSTACLAFTAPYVEDFSGSTVGHWSGADNCWEFSSNNPGTTSSSGYSWEVRNTAQVTSSGTGPDRDATIWPTMGGKFVTADVSGSSTFTPDSTVMTSPVIDISGLNNPELGYALHRYGSNMADLYVDVFDGTSWVNGVHSYTNLSGIQTSSGADWLDTTVSLSSYSGITNLRVRFRSVTNGCCAGDNAIDDVRISDPISCSAPLGVMATAASSTSADVSWDTTGTGAATVELEYGASGFMPGTGTLVTGLTATTYTITGLTTTNLCQDVYVRSICTSGDTSLWVGPISACPDETLCTDDFDQYATGPIDEQSALFVGWYGGAAGDGEVSTTRASSGTQSLNITDQGSAGFTDLVAYFDTISSGAWELSWEMYVETGDGGYFNIQQNHALSGVGNQWNAELYFQSNGSVRVQHSAAATVVGNFNYTQGSWFTMSTIIDLDNDTIWFEVNGLPVNVGFTYSAANVGQPLQFNGVNFYSGVLGGSNYDIDYYVDDFCVQPAVLSTPCPLVNQLQTANTACDETTVSWASNSGGSIIEYGVAPLTPGTGTFTGIVTSPFTITGLMPGTNYDIRVADTCGTDTSGYRQQSITTASGPLPNASFTIDSAIVGGNYEVYVNASSSAGATNYSWDYGNGSTGTGMMDTASYSTNGMYTITLVVTNGCGSDTATFTTNVNIGLDENELDRSLSIFPNPANNVVNVSFSEVGSGDVFIRLADAQGRTVMELSDKLGSSTYSKALDVSKLAAGVYMIEVSSGDMAAMRRISISK